MRRTTTTYDPSGLFPPAIKWLLIANGVVFVASLLAGGIVVYVLGLQPAVVIGRGWVWQPLTYMFVHAGLFHLLLNMFVLWMFGAEIERLWGTSEFVKYYVLCGLGAAALSFVFNYHSVVIGASGAVLGVLLAFGMLFPDRYVYLWFLIPVRAKWLVAGIAGLEIVYLVAQRGGHIANAAHVGGMAVGYAYLKWWDHGSNPVERFLEARRRRRLTLIEGGRDEGDSEVEEEIDRILDKISKTGLDSLTPEEERILDQASRRRHRD